MIKDKPYSITSKILQFKEAAGTSRGVYLTRKIWIIKWSFPEMSSIEIAGECAPLPQLSIDDIPQLKEKIEEYCALYVLCRKDYSVDTSYLPNSLLHQNGISCLPDIGHYPSIRFALESIEWQYEMIKREITHFPVKIPINGLIWMGDRETMAQRIHEKIDAGFKCLKLKIGAINWTDEVELIRTIRSLYGKESLTIRVDANGAFQLDKVLSQLEELARYDLHSIEQPIHAGQFDEMARCCKTSPLAIALDEELIPITNRVEKIKLLEKIKPQYIILKPSLMGGISGSIEWIQLAEERNIQWWITSALESNIGLDTLAFCTQYIWSSIHPNDKIPHQGLGTGQLFVENFPSVFSIQGEYLTNEKEV
ncbi:MAG: o-succinylbenzoate synthase [Bacteroidaceae bacterium]